MATQTLEREQMAPPLGGPRDHDDRRTAVMALLSCAFIVVVMFIAHNARHGAVATRIKNAAVQGAPRPDGRSSGGPTGSGSNRSARSSRSPSLVVAFVVLWRRYPKHPILLMVLACTSIVWKDPIMNWAPYAVYNPQLSHWPETWPLVSLSPTVEPFVVIGYVMFYLAPYFPAIWILRRLQQRTVRGLRSSGGTRSSVWRR